MAVQHPSSTDLGTVPENRGYGAGDALWTFDLTNIVPSPCEAGTKGQLCQRSRTKFAKQLNKAAKKQRKSKK